MTSILSSISGLFSKALILGTLLPVVVFVMLGWALAVPLVPLTNWPALKPFEALDTQWKVLATSFLTVVLAGLLYNVNIPLIRVYEGYPWKDLWVGVLRTRKYKRLYRVLRAQWRGVPHIQYWVLTESAAKAKDKRLKPIAVLKDAAGQRLGTDFPDDEDLILPTRLGNAIRSFEHYPQKRYGMDAVALWPRLIAKIDKDYAAGVDGAKTSFDFMLNCSALSLLLGLLLLALGLLYPGHLNTARGAIVWVAEMAALWGLSHLFYYLSVGRARFWGDMVRGAFDLYRWDLLKQLGYSSAPETPEAERELWQNISKRIIYGDHHEFVVAAYATNSLSARVTPPKVTLSLWRGAGPTNHAVPAPVSPGAQSGEQITVEIRVKNVSDYDAKGIVLTDKLPDDFAYRWNSAALVRNEPRPEDAGQTAAQAEGQAVQPVTVTGMNPYRFEVGSLRSKGDLILTYQALPMKTEVKDVAKTEAESEEKADCGADGSSLVAFSGTLFAYSHKDAAAQGGAETPAVADGSSPALPPPTGGAPGA